MRWSRLFNFFVVVVVDRLGFEHCMCGTSVATWKDWDSVFNNRSGMLDNVVVGDATRMRSHFDARDDRNPLRHCCWALSRIRAHRVQNIARSWSKSAKEG